MNAFKRLEFIEILRHYFDWIFTFNIDIDFRFNFILKTYSKYLKFR
jgi:hypothetical protein